MKRQGLTRNTVTELIKQYESGIAKPLEQVSPIPNSRNVSNS